MSLTAAYHQIETAGVTYASLLLPMEDLSDDVWAAAAAKIDYALAPHGGAQSYHIHQVVDTDPETGENIYALGLVGWTK